MVPGLTDAPSNVAAAADEGQDTGQGGDSAQGKEGCLGKAEEKAHE